MDFLLKMRMISAGLSRDPERIAAVGEEFRELLTAGDPGALRLYRETQNQLVGPDPLADGAFDWPAELTEPGTVLEVPESDPIMAWRMWAVRDGRLLAPFLTSAGGLDP